MIENFWCMIYETILFWNYFEIEVRNNYIIFECYVFYIILLFESNKSFIIIFLIIELKRLRNTAIRN